MLISFLFFICELTLGTLLIDFFDFGKKFNIWEKILFSFSLGFLISNFCILIFALLLKSLLLAIILYCIAFFIILGLRYDFLIKLFNDTKSEILNHKWNLKKDSWMAFFLITGIPYFYYLWNLVYLDKNGHIKAFLSGWGDNGFHISLIQRFANANPFNLDNPLLSGAKITYHFIFDFSSAVLYFLNNDLVFSYRLPLVTFGVILFCSLFVFVLRIYRSKILAISTIILIFLGSGLGFIFALAGTKISEYTSIKFDADVSGSMAIFRNINWLVPLVSFLSHQRAFLIGATCFILLLTAIIVYGKDKKFWRYGIIAGLLPLAHVHTFFAIFLTMAVLIWFYLKNFNAWLKFAFITLILCLPQIIYLKMANNGGESFFLRPYFGWMACSHNNSWFFCDQFLYHDNVFFFWVKNFGFIFIGWILILLLTIYLKYKKSKLINFDSKFLFASAILFIVPNIFLFQPWNYDNNKVLFYWQFLAVVFCILPISQYFWRKNIAFKPIIVIFVILSIASGLLDFSIKLVTLKSDSFGYSDGLPENIEMADWIKKNTAPNSLFLTSSWVDPVPVFLAGRKIFLGYPGWLWTEGLDYYKNQKMGEEILGGNMNLACKEKIDYILFDKALKDSYNTLNEEYILNNSQIIYSQNTSEGLKMILKITCKK